MTKKKVVIIGANSDIALACAEQYQSLGHEVILAGHKSAELPNNYQIIEFDVLQPNLETLIALDVHIVVYCAGRFTAADNWLNHELNSEMIAVNFTSAVAILNGFAAQFKDKRKGTIVGISSVAAVRGKQSTIVYGASKAGFDSYLSGLRALLAKSDIRVLTVRPGFVDTKMTKSLTLNPKLTAQPNQIAKSIVKHSLSGNRNILYYKPIWRLIMCAIRMIPEPIFKRLKL